MSEHMVSVVSLDDAAHQGARLIEQVTQWLLDEGVIQPNARRDKLSQPSGWLPGPRWEALVVPAPGNESFITWANNGVEIVAERQVHHPVENYEPPTCGRCDVAIDPDVHHALVEDWLAAEEPQVACASCGWTAPIGDWPAEWGFAVGAPAVVFNNWPILTDEFVASLRSVLGGRTYLVRTHI